MATTTTNFTPAPSRFSYSGLDVPSNVPIPAAEISFRVDAGTVTAAAAAEDQKWQLHCYLAEGYAYILKGLNLYIYDAEAGDMADWTNQVACWLTNNTDGAPQYIIGLPMAGDIALTTAVLKSASWQVALPKKIIIPLGGHQGELHLAQFNPVADGGPMTLYFQADFLQFSIEQAHHWAINTPWPVR